MTEVVICENEKLESMGADVDADVHADAVEADASESAALPVALPYWSLR